VDADSQIPRGERACPALGCVAAPQQALSFTRKTSVSLLGPLRSPTRGKPARHKACSLHVVVFLVGFQRLEPLAFERLAQLRAFEAFLQQGSHRDFARNLGRAA